MEYFTNPEDNFKQNEKNSLFSPISAKKEDVFWEQDPKAYFTIMPYYSSKKIMVRVYDSNHKPLFIFDGKKPNHIYHAIISRGLISSLFHAAYLGKELQKAFTALNHGLYYIQDDPLDWNKKIKL